MLRNPSSPCFRGFFVLFSNEPSFTARTIIPPVITLPTQAELDFQAWVKDRADLKKLKELVSEGIVPANSTEQTTLQNKVNTGWKKAYFNLI